MPYFRKVTNDEGEEVYEEVPVEEIVSSEDVEIPAERLRNHPEYRKVVDEAAKRRLTNKELKKQLQELEASLSDGSEDEEEVEASPNDQAPPQPQIDIDELYSQFRERLEKEEAEKTERKKTRAQKIEEAIQKHNLLDDENIRGMFEEIPDTKIDLIASSLAKAGLKFDNLSGGAGRGRTSWEEQQAELDTAIFGPDGLK